MCFPCKMTVTHKLQSQWLKGLKNTSFNEYQERSLVVR